ncbi:hypothetical protein QJS04_geneDACA012406 [Acorus gramineus]|uniref:Uncharacterized protein n=1 Tax=Acorus gramineus TaxID=55184 RepID=A0AAV9BDN4_ACOGR|nr:hypothetical protein QJS04_geneDACA012406 [Acorus gramineus]
MGCNATTGTLDDSAYTKPLPLIALYIAASSLLIATAMGTDALLSIRRWKLWFPCKWFALNATSLTVLAISTKLPVDLNTSMPGRFNQLSKLTGTVLLCTAIGNFMPSLGATGGSDVLSNVLALAILVVTVIVNVGIQMGTGVIYLFLPEHIIVLCFMFLLLVILGFSALVVPTTKELIEKKYDLAVGELNDCVNYNVDELKVCVKKYWLMAHTSSPQFVLGRSATCTASGAFCLVCALILVEVTVRCFFFDGSLDSCGGESDYGWGIKCVLVSQGVAVLVGTIAPAYRWFGAIRFRRTKGGRTCRDEFKMEEYWVHRLMEWRETPLHFEVCGGRCLRRIVHGSKNAMLQILIWLQTVVVVVSKSVRICSVWPVAWLNCGMRLLVRSKSSPSLSNGQEDFSKFVMHLEGEEDLVTLITRSGHKDTDRWIRRGGKKKTHFIQFLEKHLTTSQGFGGVREFNSKIHDIQSIVSKEPPNCWALPLVNCWALPLVTLASIAVTLPTTNRGLIKSLMWGVGEGLEYVRLIEKQLDGRGLVNMRNAADIVWLKLDLYNHWLDVDLCGMANQERNTNKIIENLSVIAEKRVCRFVSGDGRFMMNHLEWPEKVLAATCLYRVCKTVLSYQDRDWDENKLFEWLQMMISDILGACLTNLPRVINMECSCFSVKEREQRVRDATFVLGEAESILKTLETPEVTNAYPEKKEYIDNWLPTGQRNICSMASASSHQNGSSEDVFLAIECISG